MTASSIAGFASQFERESEMAYDLQPRLEISTTAFAPADSRWEADSSLEVKCTIEGEEGVSERAETGRRNNASSAGHKVGSRYDGSRVAI